MKHAKPKTLPQQAKLSKTQLKVLFGIDVFQAVAFLGGLLYLGFFVTDNITKQPFYTTILRYFTTLGDFFMMLCCAFSAICVLRVIRGKSEKISEVALTFRFVGVCAVTITMLVVVFYLVPIEQDRNLLYGVNRIMHTGGPLLVIISHIVFRLSQSFRFRRALLGMLPLCLYGVYYVGNILINGFGEGPFTNDWYYFFNGSFEHLPIIAAIMIGLSFLISVILWRAGRRKIKAQAKN